MVSFDSIEKVPKITSPVLVIHGTEDEVIDVSHGVAIYERCPRPVEPLFIEVGTAIFSQVILFCLGTHCVPPITYMYRRYLR